jgi:hypothetical protein
MIAIYSRLIWTWNQFHWKGYLLTFHGVQERPNWMSYVTWASILIWPASRWVGLWIWKLFQQLWPCAILVWPGTDAIGNIVLSSFRSYVERPNPMLYVSCTSIWSWGGPGPWVGLEVKLWNSELNWTSTLMCASPCLSNALLMSHKPSSSSSWFLTIIKSLGSNRFSKYLVEGHKNELQYLKDVFVSLH